MPQPILHRNEKEILRTLFREGRPLSISEISSYSCMSWVTVKKYLNRCISRKIVAEEKQNKRPRYVLDPELITALLQRGDSGE
ncbi:MAG: hypothetical protein R6V53_01425 [Candidatus Woesearchaeota archaeon]